MGQATLDHSSKDCTNSVLDFLVSYENKAEIQFLKIEILKNAHKFIIITPLFPLYASSLINLHLRVRAVLLYSSHLRKFPAKVAIIQIKQPVNHLLV